MAEFNKVMAYVYASNGNAQPLGGEAMLTAVAKYVVGYCAKNPVQLTNILSTVRQVMLEKAPDDVPEGQRNAWTLKRMVVPVMQSADRPD